MSLNPSSHLLAHHPAAAVDRPDQAWGGWSGGLPDVGWNSSRPTSCPSTIPTMIASMKGQIPSMPTIGPNIMAAPRQAAITTAVVTRTRQSSGYSFMRLPFLKRAAMPHCPLLENQQVGNRLQVRIGHAGYGAQRHPFAKKLDNLGGAVHSDFHSVEQAG